MELKNKKIAIFAEDNYQEMELWYPYYRMLEAGAKVNIIGSHHKKQCKSKLGYPVNVDKQAEDVNADEYDAIIIPGGYAPDIMRRHESMLKLIREANEKNKIIAAICHAGWVLISANVIKGKKATCYYAIKDDMKNAGANYVDEPVVQDGNIITSRQPDDLPVFCKTIINALI